MKQIRIPTTWSVCQATHFSCPICCNWQIEGIPSSMDMDLCPQGAGPLQKGLLCLQHLPVVRPSQNTWPHRLTTPLQIALIAQDLDCSTPFQQQRICGSMGPMSPMLLQKLCHQCKISISTPAEHSKIGGLITGRIHQYLIDMSSQSLVQCKTTQNIHVSGKSMSKNYPQYRVHPNCPWLCVCSGTILNESVLFMQQADNFAVSAPSKRITNHVLDLINDLLFIPMKQQGLLTLYNCLDILQTKKNYIKVSCKTYINRISCTHIKQGWMKKYLISDCPTPLPTNLQFLKDIQTTKCDPDQTAQKTLEKKMGFSYQSGIGQLVYPMVWCWPDLSFVTVKLSQYNSCSTKIQFDGVGHALRNLYQTRTEGLLILLVQEPMAWVRY